MIDYTPLLHQLRGGALERWAELLPAQLDSLFSGGLHGDFPRWMETLGKLPVIEAVHLVVEVVV